MKKILLFLVCLPVVIFAQEQTSFTIIEHGANYDIIKIKVGAVQFHNVLTPTGIEERVTVNKGTQLIEKAAPDLAKLSFSMVVPNAQDGRAEVLSSKFEEIKNIKVAPSKGKIYRHERPEDFPYLYGDNYSKDEFYPNKIVELNTPYILRKLRGQAVHAYPLQYNPVSKTLRVLKEITLKITYDKVATENVLNVASEFPTSIQHDFDQIYRYQFLNYKTLFGQYTPMSEHGKMLILCDAAYASAMPEFIEWKNRKGIEVFYEITDTMTGGPTEINLLNRISYHYNQNDISYLLIVGDATDIPARNSYWNVPGIYGPSDWAYTYQIGNDHYPEFMVGRFSADTLQEAITQVQRTLEYEKNMNTSSTWMRKQVAMGSDQGPGDKGQFDHEHLREIADSNKNYGPYVYNYEFFDGTHGGNDAPGAPPVNSLTDAINDGIGLINYCGHGSTDIFITSTFTGMGQVPLLTNNNGEWPFVFSTACQNGNFVYATCLGEALLRAHDTMGNPKGAIAAIMSSINQSWDPPMQGQDEMNAILCHNRPGTYQTTFGSIASSGIMSTNDHYNTYLDSNGGNEIADTWVVFGDPSVVLYTRDDVTLNCTHNATIGKNSTKFEVNCAEDNAIIGLYYEDDFLASAVVENGVAKFNFPAVVNLDTIFVTATKQNMQPYYGIVEVVNGIPFSVNDLAKYNIAVYPNPVTSFVRIADKENRVRNAELFDMNGRLLLQTEETQIDMSQLSSGIYQLRLHTKEAVLTTSVRKQ
jgi:gingipain R